ncbi:hypothetical protein DR088_03600 [Mycoplasma hyopneumoniae]|nr:hypothetical protein [Mesomycoplasma hyopneumoniae]MXR64166.1 hypothetical protein [Mesomycoplasma hyopneumoniae]
MNNIELFANIRIKGHFLLNQIILLLNFILISMFALNSTLFIIKSKIKIVFFMIKYQRNKFNNYVKI